MTQTAKLRVEGDGSARPSAAAACRVCQEHIEPTLSGHAILVKMLATI